MDDFIKAYKASNGIGIVEKKGTTPDIIRLSNGDLFKKITVGSGVLNNIELAPKYNKITETGFNQTRDAFLAKARSIMTDAESELQSILKSYANAGIIKVDSTVPANWYRLNALGSKNDAIPAYFELALSQPYIIDMNNMLNIIGIKEDEVKEHLEDVKAYWSIIDSAQSNVIIDLAKKINSVEEVFFKKACEFTSYMANKTLTRTWDTRAITCTSKGCEKFMKYVTDPFLTFATEMATIAAPNGTPSYAVYADLISLEDKEFSGGQISKYAIWPSLFYKVDKGMFGNFKFSRQGQSW